MEAIRRLLASQKQPGEEPTGSTFLIVGLGNPGREYRENRHNIGFMALDSVNQALHAGLGRLQSRALVSSVTFNGSRLILAKPQTYMNLSGQSVASLMRFYKLPLSQLLVVHDDLDLPLGTLRLRPGGGSAGQRGLASTIQQLGTQDFPRLRLGIGRPPGQMDAADYVLQNFSSAERELLKQVLERAVQAVQAFVSQGLEKAMNEFNGSLSKE